MTLPFSYRLSLREPPQLLPSVPQLPFRSLSAHSATVFSHSYKNISFQISIDSVRGLNFVLSSHAIYVCFTSLEETSLADDVDPNMSLPLGRPFGPWTGYRRRGLVGVPNMVGCVFSFVGLFFSFPFPHLSVRLFG